MLLFLAIVGKLYQITKKKINTHTHTHTHAQIAVEIIRKEPWHPGLEGPRQRKGKHIEVTLKFSAISPL